jgi:hypothetical protein
MHGGKRKGGSSSDVLEELLANPGATVLGLLELGNPVINRCIKLSKSFFLLENGIVAELGSARRPEILANAGVKVASPRAERSISAAKILSSLIKLPEFLGDRQTNAEAKCVYGGLTRERLSTSSFLKTSNRAAC